MIRWYNTSKKRLCCTNVPPSSLIQTHFVVFGIDNLSKSVARVIEVKPYIVSFELIPSVPRASFTQVLPNLFSRGDNLVDQLNEGIVDALPADPGSGMYVTGCITLEVLFVE